MTTNVRFYRLDELPSFIVDKHKGIFVHVTKTMYKDGGSSIEHPNPKNPVTLYMTPEKSGESIERMNLVQWLTERRIDKIASGLWFGGENGWELLSNETNSAAINAAITTKIQELHVDGYAQAEITPDTPAEGVPNSSTLTIKGIKEDNGIISEDTNQNLVIAIDGVYTESNKIATKSTVITAINGLNTTETIQAVTFNTPVNGGNTTLTFNGVKETNGVIAQGDGTSTFIVGDAKLKIQIGSNEASAFDVFSANAQSNGAIKLNEYVFKKDENNVISVITPTAVSERNRLVTEQDIANLSSAMHYKGSIASDSQWPANENVKAGDVYIVTTSFTHSGESNPFEVGDMIVFNSENRTDFTVVQSNITLGIKSGQIAKNDGDLTPNYMVIATSNGIKTIGITEDDLTGADNNKRELSYRNGTPDTDTTNNITLHHDVTISDAFQVIGKDFNQSINISSTNRSIEIAANGNTGVKVDLVWNTTIE